MFVENGISMEVQLAYDTEGKVTTMQYPSGDIHRYVYNAAGRQTEMQKRFVSEQGVESWQAHSTATYGDVGEMVGMTGPFGSQTWGYNSRMQMTSYTLAGSLSLTYKYDDAGQNDGKLTELWNNTTGEKVRYSYDFLGRLESAATFAGASPWSQTFTYDGFGTLYGKA